MSPVFHRRKSAFTLVELMVATSISLIIVVVLTHALTTLMGTWTRGGQQAESRAGARMALDLIGRELAAAYIDLDLGWQLIPASAGMHDPELKMLTRREPDNPENSSLYRVSYRLGWAAYTLGGGITFDDRFRQEHVSGYDTPVLIRTSSSDISPVFNARPPRTAQSWVDEWPDPNAPFAATNGAVEAVVDQVLGWKIELLEWDDELQQFEVTVADEATQSGFERLRTAEEDLRVIRVTLALVASGSLPVLSSYPEFYKIRSRDDLFTLLDEPPEATDNFGRILKQHLRLVTSTFRLESKTP